MASRNPLDDVSYDELMRRADALEASGYHDAAKAMRKEAEKRIDWVWAWNE